MLPLFLQHCHLLFAYSETAVLLFAKKVTALVQEIYFCSDIFLEAIILYRHRLSIYMLGGKNNVVRKKRARIDF